MRQLGFFLGMGLVCFTCYHCKLRDYYCVFSDPRPDSYLIYYDNMNEPFASPSNVNISQLKSYIQNLKPFTTYELWVVPYSGLVPGPPSAKVQVLLLEDSKPHGSCSCRMIIHVSHCVILKECDCFLTSLNTTAIEDKLLMYGDFLCACDSEHVPVCFECLCCELYESNSTKEPSPWHLYL